MPEAGLGRQQQKRQIPSTWRGATKPFSDGALGPGRTLTLAPYELFLMAARDPSLREPLVQGRERFVAAASAPGRRGGGHAGRRLDGLVLDALVRGSHDPAARRGAVARIMDIR